MSKPSEELLRRALEFAETCGHPVNTLALAELTEQIVRECAEITRAHKRKDYDYRCSQEFRNGYECAAELAERDILSKFGLKE